MVPVGRGGVSREHAVGGCFPVCVVWKWGCESLSRVQRGKRVSGGKGMVDTEKLNIASSKGCWGEKVPA